MASPLAQQLPTATKEDILATLTQALTQSDEAPFWSEKTVPFVNAVLSVLLPLRDQHLLFTPEGRMCDALTPELFLRWCDLVSLKLLAFTLQESNEANVLCHTDYDLQQSRRYIPVELETLGTYLSGYMINLECKDDDFPIAHYNLHVGITTVVKGML